MRCAVRLCLRWLKFWLIDLSLLTVFFPFDPHSIAAIAPICLAVSLGVNSELLIKLLTKELEWRARVF